MRRGTELDGIPEPGKTETGRYLYQGAAPMSHDYPVLRDGYGHEFVKVPVEDFVQLEVRAESQREALRKAAKAVVDAVDRNLDTKEQPYRYLVPWRVITDLRAALKEQP